MKQSILLICSLFVLGFGGVSVAQDFRPSPEVSSGFEKKEPAQGEAFMAVTANPLATDAAYNVLKNGGSALDAAIAAQAVLGLVEPQSSGLGGGAFLVYYDKAQNKITTLDGRETAPANIKPNIFEGKSFYRAVLSGDSIGVPGTPALLAEMYERSPTKIPFIELLQPAIDLAEKGFEISPRLKAAIQHEVENDRVTDDFTAYFSDSEVIKNQAYAETLKHFADYRDVPKQRLLEKLNAVGNKATMLDLEDYKVIEREPVCGTYRSYKVCSMAEPSSGGLAILQILGMVEKFPLSEWGADSAKSWHVIAEASRLAFKDRNQYVADPDYAESMTDALLAPDYLAMRSMLIKPDQRNNDINAGQPDKEGGTSHISIVDALGNIVSMTTTIESAFGSHFMVDGYFLNNELTDFSFETVDSKGKLIANRPEGGKRPRSSMAPTIVFSPDGAPFLVVGSAGGSRIIGYVTQRIISAIDWGMDIEENLNKPNILSRGESIELENGFRGTLFLGLLPKGHDLVVGEQNSGLSAIQFNQGQMTGYADPRREGVGKGE